MAQQDWSELQQRIAALSPEKRAIFEQQLQQRNLQLSNAPLAIPKRPNPADRPLSFAQQRLWFLHQLNPDSPAYNIAMLWDFQGSLHVLDLERTLNAIMQRHETLRTAFKSIDGHPIQTVSDQPLSVTIVNLQDRPDPAHNIQFFARQEARKPFDLTRSPLLRATLLQISKDRSVLLLTLHHIIADGWSRGILMKEFASLYKAFVTGQPSPLADLPIQYPDFALWQQQTLQPEFDRQLTYWKQQLADLPPLSLTLGKSPSLADSDTFESAIATHTLPVSLLVALKSLSRQAGTTLFMTLLAAFKLLLHRYTGQADFAVGIPVANRNTRETEQLIGFFVNTLIIRTNFSGNPDFHTLLTRVREVTAAAYKHQDLPFAKLVEVLQPQRSLSDNPLFQVMFQLQNETYQLQNALAPDLNIPNLTLSQDWIDSGFTKFDLTWHLVERDEGLLAVAEYRTDLFDAEAIARMLGHFQILLESIVLNPTQRLSELPILTAEEHQQILNWNLPSTDIPQLHFHQQFEAQVERTPDQIAIRYQNQTLTYQQLNAQANQLAHYLRSLGVTPESLVGIHLERSLSLMVGLLGILKSGAAYVPVDTTTPGDRLTFILEDAKIKLLITDSFHLPNLQIISPTDPQISRFPTHNPQSLTTPDHLAYLIYTSGSTGKPKGTLLTHRGLTNYLHWCVQTYITPGAIGAPVQSSISFDATITSLYTPLLVGQSVVLLMDAVESLAQSLTSRYSFIKLTPAHLRLLSQWLTLNPMSQIVPQTFILGGESLAESDLTFWRIHAPGSRFINEYGPTEAVVGCCVHEAVSSVGASIPVPIGRPIPNMRLYILDQYSQLVPVGISGELYIGGTGLSRGYLNRPELTAERFIPSDLGGEATRLYQTGDRARYRSDGTIDYLGRFDHQVKIRGYRVELEEIAIVLNQHPHIQESVVVAVLDPNGSTRLVTYFTAALATSPTLLRQFLKTQLPDYMLPALFLPIAVLPLTTNGKIDRQALPHPTWVNVDNAQLFADRSLTEIEETLVRIWAEILGVPVRIHDNFFELGGDSILSLQIIARANQAGLKLSPRQIFQYQTIAELAPVAEPSIHAEQGAITGTVPLTPIQHWFFKQNLPEPHHFNQSLLLEVIPNLNPQFLETALQQLCTHHDALRLRFVQEEGGWHQFHAPIGESIALQVIDLAHLPCNEQTQAIETISNQLQSSLNLSQCLGQCVLFKLGNSSSDRLLIILHHLIVDGVSWQIFLEDLVVSYQQSDRGQLLQLPPKTTAFRDWAQQLMLYAQSDALKAELPYWSKVCASPTLPIEPSSNGDYPLVGNESISVMFSIKVPEEVLKKSAQSHRKNFNEMIITALSFTLKQWAKSDIVKIDLEGHGREDLFETVDISRTVGWFTTIFPVSLNLSTAMSVQSSLKLVQEYLYKVPKNGIGYGILQYLYSSEIFSNSSRSTVKFNYLGSIDRLAQSFILGQAKESSGQAYSPLQQRYYALEVNSWISAGQLHFKWVSSHQSRVTLQYLADQCVVHLQTLLNSEMHPNATDFPAARLNQKQLDQLMSKIQQPGRK